MSNNSRLHNVGNVLQADVTQARQLDVVDLSQALPPPPVRNMSFDSTRKSGQHRLGTETYELSGARVRKVGTEMWFMNETRIVWTHRGNLVSDPEKTARALRECGFEITETDLDLLINSA
jgi:hypothetical protein